MQSHAPAAQKLCFLPLNGITEALADLRGRFDAVDCNVELVATAMAAQQTKETALPWSFKCGVAVGALAGLGFVVALACCRLELSGSERPRQRGLLSQRSA